MVWLCANMPPPVEMLRTLGKSLRLRWKRGELLRSSLEERWRDGVREELEYWKKVLATKGLEWPDAYRELLAPDTPLQSELTELLQPTQDRELRLLDIGAGPLTVLGKTMPGRSLSIVATDALAEEYDKLLNYYGVQPPVRTIECPGEQLLERFSRNYFHLVYARNCLDHSIDPLSIIRIAIQLTRPDGCVVLHHWPCEAERAGYAGLHQWNFDFRRGKTLLWRPGTRYHLETDLANIVSVSSRVLGNQCIHTVLRPAAGVRSV